MADINSPVTTPARRATTGDGKPAPMADAGEAIRLVELLFFAYRDFTADPDAVLSDFGFGRAHHRVLHFVNRNPGLRVADLLDILKITKQSLARVLKQLVDEGYIDQHAGTADRRERLLVPTPKGAALAEELATLQVERVARALAEAEAAVGERRNGQQEAGPEMAALDAADLGAGLPFGPAALVERFLYGMITPADRAQVERLTGTRATEESR